MLGIMAGMVQKDSYSGMCQAGISGETVEIPQLQFLAGRRLPFRAERFRSCSVFWWSMPLLCRSCSLPVVVHDRCPRFRHAESRGGAGEAVL